MFQQINSILDYLDGADPTKFEDPYARGIARRYRGRLKRQLLDVLGEFAEAETRLNRLGRDKEGGSGRAERGSGER